MVGAHDLCARYPSSTSGFDFGVSDGRKSNGGAGPMLSGTERDVHFWGIGKVCLSLCLKARNGPIPIRE
jgi:hypothetical protein